VGCFRKKEAFGPVMKVWSSFFIYFYLRAFRQRCMHDILASRSPHGWGGGEGEGLVVLYVGFGVEWASWPNKGLSIEWALLAFVVHCINGARQIVFFAMLLP
jgi:hypothetical protein